MTKLAAIQFTSSTNVQHNLITAAKYIAQAAMLGAQLIVLPEDFALMGKTDSDKLAIAEIPGSNQAPLQNFLAEQAAKHQIYLVGGTIPLRSDDPQKVRSACLLFDPQGQQIARYDKIHLFDVLISSSQEIFRESQRIQPGQEPVVIQTPLGRIGFAICYDIRFPELCRHLVNMGAEIIVVPAAFTAATGKAHWEILLRARAIENLSYVIASAQNGRHENGRQTYGNSMIVEPWGTVLLRCIADNGVIVAECDLEKLHALRQQFPVLEHRVF